MATPFLGEIRMFGGNFAISGWALCNGQTLPISEYSALFALIGTTYGGDGQNTFALPNLQSRIPVHQGSGFVIGQIAGEENHTLLSNELPTHTHPVGAQTAGSASTPSGNYFGGGGPNIYKTSSPTGTMNSGVVAPNAGGLPHDNQMPFLVVNFIIALEGIFPTRN